MNNPASNELPREGEITKEIDGLIQKLVRGDASVEDRARLNELSEIRSRLMLPPAFIERRKRVG